MHVTVILSPKLEGAGEFDLGVDKENNRKGYRDNVMVPDAKAIYSFYIVEENWPSDKFAYISCLSMIMTSRMAYLVFVLFEWLAIGTTSPSSVTWNKEEYRGALSTTSS